MRLEGPQHTARQRRPLSVLQAQVVGWLLSHGTQSWRATGVGESDSQSTPTQHFATLGCSHPETVSSSLPLVSASAQYPGKQSKKHDPRRFSGLDVKTVYLFLKRMGKKQSRFHSYSAHCSLQGFTSTNIQRREESFVFLLTKPGGTT